MKNLKGWLLLLVIFVVLPIGGLVFLWKDRCLESTLATVASPLGGYSAETFVKDCGPAMKPATMVRVLKQDESGTDDKMVLLVHDRVSVDVSWKPNGALQLVVPKSATVVTYKREWEKLKIVLKKS